MAQVISIQRMVYCENCCVKNRSTGNKSYHHNLLGAAIVKPGVKQVLPLCPEPIKNQDGAKKNDCKHNATKRFLNDLKREHPHLKMTILQDALSDNGPNVLNLYLVS